MPKFKNQEQKELFLKIKKMPLNIPFDKEKLDLVELSNEEKYSNFM